MRTLHVFSRLGPACLFACLALSPTRSMGGLNDTSAGTIPNSATESTSETWAKMFFRPGLNANVEAFCLYQGDVVAVGNFTTAGSTFANHVAQWTGKHWEALGEGLQGTFEGAASQGDDLYVAGRLLESGVRKYTVAHWRKGVWSFLPTPPVTARELFSYQGLLYCGGDEGVCAWDGSDWALVPLRSTTGRRSMYAFAVLDDRLVVGGTGYVGVLADSGFVPMTEGFSGSVLALASFRGGLVAGGTFVGLAGPGNSRIAAWDGSTWSSLGAGVSGGWPYEGEVTSLAVQGSDLYVGGAFFQAGGLPLGVLARWDGRSWSAVGSDAPFGRGYQVPINTYPYIHALIVQGNKLFAGGTFTRAGEVGASFIAAWDGRKWDSVAEPGGMGLSAAVNAVAEYNGDVVVGGDFTEAGPTQANFIARWDGSAWQPLGTGLDSEVMALTVYDGKLVAAGYFRRAGGVAVERVAMWDGTSWSRLGVGMNYAVLSLGVHNGVLVAGGYFDRADNKVIYAVAAWIDGKWTDMGGGLRGGPLNRVEALYSDGADLYAGGSFKNTGTYVYASNIARWDGTRWYPLGVGIAGSVYDITRFDGHLVVGGKFTAAGDVPANAVAAWNGTSWHPFATELAGGKYGPWVRALCEHDHRLYAGGSFESAGGIPCQNLAAWNGESWDVPDAGVSAQAPGGWKCPVVGLVSMGDTLFVGGGLSNAGEFPSAYFARMTHEDATAEEKPEIPKLLISPVPNPIVGDLRIELSEAPAGPVRVRLFDAVGRIVAVLLDDSFDGRPQTLTWNGQSATGRKLPAGVYFLRVEYAGAVETRKLILTR